MLMMRPPSWLLLPVLVAACDGNRALVVSSSDANSSAPTKAGGGPFKAEADASLSMTAPGTTVVMPTKADAGIVLAVEPDGATDVSASPEGGVVVAGFPHTCDELAAGGSPDQLVDFAWYEQTGTCSSSACSTYVSIEEGCMLMVQRNDLMKTFAMSPADCAAARGWATNPLFVDVIRNGTGCADGMTPESFELTLTQDAPRRKTWGCDEPVVDLERACFNALAGRYDPP